MRDETPGRKPLFRLLLQSYVAMVVVVLVMALLFVAGSYRTHSISHARSELERQARIIAHSLQRLTPALDPETVARHCDELGTIQDTRITVIDIDGVVLGDSEKDPATMENHADRPEIRVALTGAVGSKQRYSDTLKRELTYVAVPLMRGDEIVAVARTSLPQTQLRETWQARQRDLLLPGLSIALAAALLSAWVSRHIARPAERLREGAERFGRGELDFRLETPDQRELADLADAMNRMAAELEERIARISRQGQTEERMLSSMIEGVVAVDTDERVILVNRAAVKLLALQGDTFEGRAVQEVVRQAELLRYLDRLRYGEQQVEGELELSLENDERYLQVQGVSLQGEVGETMGAMLVVHDVTRLRRLEQVQRDFVANVSHELKTPITSMHGFVETLANGAVDEPEKARRFLAIVARQTERLDAIIEDLLSLARVEGTAEEGWLQTETLRLREVLDEVIHSYGPKAGEKGLRLTIDCPESMTVEASRLLLGQAIGNLFDNAIRYSEQGGEIEIEAERTDDAVMVRVRDHGIGIAREHLPRLFERFYRVDKARSRAEGGTGLGLAIVKRVARAHGGKVGVESAPGKGSTFSIYLPVNGGGHPPA